MEEKTPLPTPILTLAKCTIRAFHPSDAPALAREANNPAVAALLRSSFPQPYTLADAESWIKLCSAPSPPRNYAIFLSANPDLDTDTDTESTHGPLCGGIGLAPLPSPDEQRTLEIGYWLGASHWGRGIMSEAVAGFVRWAFATFPTSELGRLEAHVYVPNGASAAVLVKNGFLLEGVRRRAAEKNGEVCDVGVYGLLREDLGS